MQSLQSQFSKFASAIDCRQGSLFQTPDQTKVVAPLSGWYFYKIATTQWDFSHVISSLLKTDFQQKSTFHFCHMLLEVAEAP